LKSNNNINGVVLVNSIKYILYIKEIQMWLLNASVYSKNAIRIFGLRVLLTAFVSADIGHVRIMNAHEYYMSAFSPL
jgi:hypothetical protein